MIWFYFSGMVVTHHPKPPGPYHDMMLLDSLGPPGCPCRDCCIRREDSAFHALRMDRGEGLHWEREALRRGREVSLHWDRDRDADLQWEREREREAEYWHRRATVSAYGPQDHDLPTFAFDPLPSGHPAYPEPTHSHTHSHLDIKYSSSSGYQTPRQACPCSPYQPSPSESRGYASGYQSESTSPLPPPAGCPGHSSHPSGPMESHTEAHSQPYPDTQTGECSFSCLYWKLCHEPYGKNSKTVSFAASQFIYSHNFHDIAGGMNKDLKIMSKFLIHQWWLAQLCTEHFIII